VKRATPHSRLLEIHMREFCPVMRSDHIVCLKYCLFNLTYQFSVDCTCDFNTKHVFIENNASHTAFLDKIGACRVDSSGKVYSKSPSYEFYCVQIRQKFKMKTTEPVTFLHFVRWLKTRAPTEFNQHWQSYRSRCGIT
jgi:hypothetical protein